MQLRCTYCNTRPRQISQLFVADYRAAHQDGHYTKTCSIEESPAPDIDSVRGQMLMNLDYQQSHIAQAITESEASEDFSSAKAYQTIYKHNASLYDVIAGAGSVDELNLITILAPVPETVWEMASALPIEETL